jgi:glutamyl-tRNA reductase
MKFFTLGVNHKDCPIEIREQLHFGASQLANGYEKAKSFSEIAELVILSTCNRVEFYGFAESVHAAEPALLDIIESTHSISRETFRPFLYRYEGKEATHHLFRVAAGLDSLVIGENEILGQLREAFKQANEYQTVHSLLYRLMEKALKLGKDIRNKTKINEGAVSIPSVAVELAEKIFGRLSGQKIMVLGTGDMSVLTLKNLKQAGADVQYIVSRNQERGQKLALEFISEWISIENWQEHLASIDILIASTSAPHPIVRYDQVKRVMSARRHRPLFLIDIAVPRDIESEVNSLDDVYLYNVDDLKGVSASNLNRRRREIEAAETMVDAAVLEYQGWLERLKARPTLESFEIFLAEVIDKELSRLVKDSTLSESEKTEIRARILAKLMHPPLEKIKEASLNGGVQRYLEALHSLFDLENSKSESRNPKQNANAKKEN